MEDIKELSLQDLDSVAGGKELYDCMTPEERDKLSELFGAYRRAVLDEHSGKISAEERDAKRRPWEDYYTMLCEKYSIEI